ncbi:MAG: hypothetical protein WB678_03910, partial [Stellaceae bacterium]
HTPYGARFSFMNETWVTIGWATSADDGEYIWCRAHEATFVIGKNANNASGLYNWIAPIDKIGLAFRTRDWKYERPDFICFAEGERANENVGRHVRILSGNLNFYLCHRPSILLSDRIY